MSIKGLGLRKSENQLFEIGNILLRPNLLTYALLKKTEIFEVLYKQRVTKI